MRIWLGCTSPDVTLLVINPVPACFILQSFVFKEIPVCLVSPLIHPVSGWLDYSPRSWKTQVQISMFVWADWHSFCHICKNHDITWHLKMGFLTCSAVNAVLNDNRSFNSKQPQGHCISFSTAFPPCPSGVKQQPLQRGRVFLSPASKSPQTAELSEIHALSVSKKPMAVLFEYF